MVCIDTNDTSYPLSRPLERRGQSWEYGELLHAKQHNIFTTTPTTTTLVVDIEHQAVESGMPLRLDTQTLTFKELQLSRGEALGFANLSVSPTWRGVFWGERGTDDEVLSSLNVEDLLEDSHYYERVTCCLLPSHLLIRNTSACNLKHVASPDDDDFRIGNSTSKKRTNLSRFICVLSFLRGA